MYMYCPRVILGLVLWLRWQKGFAPELHNQLFNASYEFLQSIQSVYAWSFNSITGTAIHSVPSNLSCTFVEVSYQEWWHNWSNVVRWWPTIAPSAFTMATACYTDDYHALFLVAIFPQWQAPNHRYASLWQTNESHKTLSLQPPESPQRNTHVQAPREWLRPSWDHMWE